MFAMLGACHDMIFTITLANVTRARNATDVV